MLDVPNEFSYLYNPDADKPLLMLTIPSEKFKNLVNRFPAVKETLRDRALKRLDIFRNYRQIVLIRYMKTILKENIPFLQKNMNS